VDQQVTELEPGPQVARRGVLRRRAVFGGVEILGARLRREFDLNTQPDEHARFCVRGMSGHALVCLDDRILILKRGFYAGTTFGAISATIYYRDVTGIQVGRHLTSSWIEISSPSFQGGERGRGLQHTSKRDVFKQPNYQLALGELRRFIAAAKVEQRDVPVIDQLERLAMLRRRGDVDEHEFELAKARVLHDASVHWGRAAEGS
jgi:hypothetical protein